MNSEAIKAQMNHAMTWATGGSRLTYTAVVAGVVVAIILFRLMFKDLPGFTHAIGFSLSSQASPGGKEAKSSRIKLLLWALLPGGAGYAAYSQLPRFFPSMFQ